MGTMGRARIAAPVAIAADTPQMEIPEASGAAHSRVKPNQRRATFYPYFAWLYTLGRARLQPRFQPDAVSLALIARIAAAIDDLDSLRAVGL